MKHQYQLFVICTACIFLASSVSIASEVTFTFGKIEVLKAGQQEWTFLAKGEKLAEQDLVRMPPVSLIRLKTDDSVLLPTLAGSRELTLNALILEGLQRKAASQGKHINGDFDSRPATDVLPFGTSAETDDRTQSTRTAPDVRLTQNALAELRRQLDLLPATIARDMPQLPPQNKPTTEHYPYSVLEKAQALYDFLKTINAKSSTVQYESLLYAQLLRHTEIDVDLVMNENGELLVIFDSEVPLNQSKWLTANRNLIHQKTDSQTVWISIQVKPQTQNFTTAWYEGNRVQPVKR